MQHSEAIPQFVLILCKALLHVRFFKDVLSEDYDLIEVQTKVSCIEMISNIPIDYLIIDERTIEDDIDGFLTQLSKINAEKKTSIILMTRTLKKSFDMRVKNLGVDVVIREPIDKESLLKTIKSNNPNDRIKNKVKRLINTIGFRQTDRDLDIKHRLLFNRQAQEKVQSLLKEKGTLTLLMVELDQFHKLVNQYGESISDPIIQSLEKCIQVHLRQQDLFISLGGAKLIVLMPKTSKTVGILIAEEIQKEIASTNFPIYDDWIKLTASIGVVEQRQSDQEQTSIAQFNHSLSLALGYAILAKEKGNQIISE